MLHRPEADMGDVIACERERCDQLAAIHARQVPRDAQDGKEEDIEIQGWKDAEGAANIETLKADSAGFFALSQQQRGDEIAGDHEENKYAERAIAHQAIGKWNLVVEVVAQQGV